MWPTVSGCPRDRKAAAVTAIPNAEEVGATLRTASDGFPAFIAVCAFAGLLRLRAHGDAVAYAQFRDGYRDMARTLGFEGHIAWAKAMPLRRSVKRHAHLCLETDL
jgi:hypothetical protein